MHFIYKQSFRTLKDSIGIKINNIQNNTQQKLQTTNKQL